VLVLLGAINADSLVALSAVVGTALGVGAVLGRGVRNILNNRVERRREDAQIKTAIVGKPADEFGPAEPGLVTRVTELSGFTERLAKEFHDYKKEHA
jgi:hypothetical protein